MDINWEAGVSYSKERSRNTTTEKQDKLIAFSATKRTLLLHACYVLLPSPSAAARMLGVEALHKLPRSAAQHLPACSASPLGTRAFGMLVESNFKVDCNC